MNERLTALTFISQEEFDRYFRQITEEDKGGMMSISVDKKEKYFFYFHPLKVDTDKFVPVADFYKEDEEDKKRTFFSWNELQDYIGGLKND